MYTDVRAFRWLIIMTGLGAFALNVFSFNANKATSPLAMNIGGIIKQILSIVIALTVFATPVTGMTVAGILITIAGIVMYARESYAEKMRAVAHAEATSPVKAILTTP